MDTQGLQDPPPGPGCWPQHGVELYWSHVGRGMGTLALSRPLQLGTLSRPLSAVSSPLQGGWGGRCREGGPSSHHLPPAARCPPWPGVQLGESRGRGLVGRKAPWAPEVLCGLCHPGPHGLPQAGWGHVSPFFSRYSSPIGAPIPQAQTSPEPFLGVNTLQTDRPDTLTLSHLA